MSKLVLLYALLLSHFVDAQSLTGTWLGAYRRERPDDQRVFFYRLYLKQSNDSLYGLCETLNLQTDITGMPREQAAVMARYVVYNYKFSSVKDKNSFQLFTDYKAEIQTDNNYSPFFLILICTIISPEDTLSTHPQITYSTIPVNDGAIGLLEVKKISDSVPDLETPL